MSKLSKRHKVFVDEFFNKKFNATEAYLAVYPKSNYNSARANSARLIATDNVKEEIKSRLAEMHMSSDEVLKELSEIARGDIGDFLDNNLLIDLHKGGNTKLIKRLKQKTIQGKENEIHDIDLELYDRVKVLEDIGKYHGLFSDKLDITTKGESLNPKEEDAERFDRAILTLADALRETVSGKGTEQNSPVDTSE